MQEFQVGDLVKVTGGDGNNWYELGEIYEVRAINPWMNTVFVKGVKGEFYSGFKPILDNNDNSIWIEADHLSHSADPEIERFLTELAEARKVIDESHKEPDVSEFEELLMGLVEAQKVIEESREEVDDDHFKAGDRVNISVFSKFYGLGEDNPTCEGTVSEYVPEGDGLSDFIYIVGWDNGEFNGYREGDLVPALEDEGEVSDERKLTIIFEPEQIFLAAEFIAENNPYVVQDVCYFQNRIYDAIERCAGKSTIFSTLGFYVLFTEEGDTVFVEVLVDPGLGSLHEQSVATIENETLVLDI